MREGRGDRSSESIAALPSVPIRKKVIQATVMKIRIPMRSIRSGANRSPSEYSLGPVVARSRIVARMPSRRQSVIASRSTKKTIAKMNNP